MLESGRGSDRSAETTGKSGVIGRSIQTMPGLGLNTGGVHQLQRNPGKAENIAVVCISCLNNYNFMYTQLRLKSKIVEHRPGRGE